MNWCKLHWDMLRSKLDSKGLSKFVANSASEAEDKMCCDQTSFEGFDPLLGSWMRINEQMVSSPSFNGRMMECPLCILVADGQPELVDNWLEGVTDEAMNYAIDMGWVTAQ